MLAKRLRLWVSAIRKLSDVDEQLTHLGHGREETMKFTHAQCAICLDDIFDKKEMVTFHRPVDRFPTRKPLERVDLKGEQPWCSITCLCLNCAKTIADAMIADMLEEIIQKE